MTKKLYVKDAVARIMENVANNTKYWEKIDRIIEENVRNESANGYSEPEIDFEQDGLVLLSDGLQLDYTLYAHEGDLGLVYQILKFGEVIDEVQCEDLPKCYQTEFNNYVYNRYQEFYGWRDSDIYEQKVQQANHYFL